MKFDFIQRDDELVPFVDLDLRIGAAYIAKICVTPSNVSRWIATVPRLNQLQQEFGMRGGRPQNVQGCPVSMEIVAIAVLRDSPAVQTIGSFQDAALRQIAPRAWTHAKNAIQAVLYHDSSLRLPFYIPSRRTAPPTAFSRVEYRFTTECFPGRESASTEGGMCALTALGNYAGTEGELILWEDKKVVNFRSGSTFLLPKWMHYSFTEVEAPGYQMILIQSCDGQLEDYVANGFYVPLEADTGEAMLMRKAEATAERYLTRAEYGKLP
ncbi:hypothetical protein B0H16DRAFT_1733351 [Mycena metata]|uniref:Uncharacterized protein n=1 Tax=Mycena metata TaxID=1033252 RepID=A0AAD7MTL1_9AGAR|nr:hypothetical protein B0H16DRAFT_1733351 [Mycena metata]